MTKIFHVSRSCFYRPQKETEEPYDQKIYKIFKEHQGRYGSPRIEKRMKVLGLYSGKKKRKLKTTIPKGKREKDLLSRNFTAKRPNEKWCADISHIPIRGLFI
jgi:transposase InsO family protein